MNQRSTGNVKKQTGDEMTEIARQHSEPPLAPTSDPTNPHNQEEAGDWVANSRASDRRNNEPGLTNKDRQQRTN
jgi:hypothetical protein